MKKRPLIGIAIMIFKGQKVLMHKRKGAHGQGTWAFPGGHLEFGESFVRAAIRETKEECGLRIKNPEFVYATNDIYKKENLHYITVFMKTKDFSGQVELREPQKAEKWQWFDWKKLPRPLFLPVKNLLRAKYNPFK